jgi:hypothetical protein
VFAGCLMVQFLGYQRVLATGLRAPGLEERRRAVKRWVVFAVTWQAAVVASVLVYMFVLNRAHRGGLAWIAPPVAALVGTALPYQLAATRLIRGLMAA